ncbi:unnamed protein product [Wickerhamomyces anomalus]
MSLVRHRRGDGARHLCTLILNGKLQCSDLLGLHSSLGRRIWTGVFFRRASRMDLDCFDLKTGLSAFTIVVFIIIIIIIIMSSEFDVRSSFVSVVDHLPSDIIRKLWLIQTLNLNYESLKQELDLLLRQIKQHDIPKDTYLQKVSKINHIAKQLTRDQKIYEQEMTNNGKGSAAKHAERTNKRTTTKNSKPKITLKLNISKKKDKVKEKATSSPAIKITKRKRGRPHKHKVPEEQIVNEVNDEDNDNHLYCICRRTSFGEMIGCDNPKCKYEWFHYSCVGLTRAPRGRWNCPLCKNRKKHK